MKKVNALLACLVFSGAAFAQDWSILGNSGTSSANFLGTTDNQPLIFRVNNNEAYRISNLGNILIGTTTDAGNKLHVLGKIRFETALADGFSIGNTPSSPHVVYDGINGQLNVYKIKSQNFSTSAANGSYFSTGFVQFSSNAYIQAYQNPFLVNRAYTYAGTPAGLILDNTLDNGVPVPANYKILSAKLSGTEVAYIGATGGGQFSGNTLIGTTSTSSARLAVVADAANSSGISVRQSVLTSGANLLEISNAAGTPISRFDYSGRLIINKAIGALLPPYITATRDLANVPSFGSNIPMVFIQPGGLDQSGMIVRGLDGQYTSSYLQDWQDYNNTSLMRIMSDGKFGLGVSTPSAQLHTSGTVRFAGLSNDNTQSRIIVSDANGNLSYRDASTVGGSGSISGTNNYLAKYSGTTAIGNSIVYDNGTSVGIGTTNVTEPGFKLYVESGIRTRKVKVDQSTWADYVFEPGYHLPSLQEVEAFIQKHKHLPDVPSAATVEREGLDLGDNQAVLLKKIEELTLYLIEQDKALKQKQEKIEELTRKMSSFEQRLMQLEKLH